MEVLSLLKYLRGSGSVCQTFGGGDGIRPDIAVTTISASTTPPAEEESSDDDGPFFDLEFPDPADESDNTCLKSDVSVPDVTEEPREEASEISDDGREFDLAPKDLEAEDIHVSLESAQSNSQILPVSLLRKKLRVLMLGLRKQKSDAVDPHSSSVLDTLTPPELQSQRQGSASAVKIEVEEVPIVSLFTRDYSSRNGGFNKPTKQQTDDSSAKKPSKELVQKYLGKINPLYVRGSKRSAEKSKLNSEQVFQEEEKEDKESSSSSLEESSPKTAQKHDEWGAIPAGLRVVRKHLGKNRTSSAAVTTVPSPPPMAPKRQDDSLLQQEDGIQSAIAHCKMSLGVRRDPAASADCSEKAREESVA